MRELPCRVCEGRLEPETPMTSLVIGASGQVGALLYAYARRQAPCIGTYYKHARPGLVPLDLRDHAAVHRLVREVRPDVCFLPAALIFMDYAEGHPDECRQTNVLGVANAALALAPTTGVLVLFSTNHVFGDGRRARREDEAPDPVSAYGRSKAEAERMVRALLPGRHLILRTSGVYGPDPQEKNFFYRVRRTLEHNEVVTVPADQHGQPTFGPDLARTALELAARGAAGTFHVVGPRYMTRGEWARLIAAGSGLPTHLIHDRPTLAPAGTAPRPLRVRLGRRKLLAFLGRDPIRSPRQGVRQMVRAVRQVKALSTAKAG